MLERIKKGWENHKGSEVEKFCSGMYCWRAQVKRGNLEHLSEQLERIMKELGMGTWMIQGRQRKGEGEEPYATHQSLSFLRRPP